MLITEIDARDFADFDDHEKLVVCLDDESGLRAYIAIHNRNLGPALGGCRIRPYPAGEDAIKDVLRLSRGMTYKSALAGLALGGGKAVIAGDPREKHPSLFRAMGRFIDSLAGAYITAEDAGTTVADLREIAAETPYVTGISRKQYADGTELEGDPSPSTAYGVLVGIKAAVKHRLGSEDLAGVRVAVQGAGNVGRRLVKLLVEAGARVTVSDINPQAVEATAASLPVDVVDNDAAHSADVDVYAPCALGGSISVANVHEIRAPIIAGAANNQLADAAAGMELHRQGKTWAPDYVINAGGIIDIQYERLGYDHGRVLRHIERIAGTLERVLTVSDERNLPTNVVADRLAEKRFQRKDARAVA